MRLMVAARRHSERRLTAPAPTSRDRFQTPSTSHMIIHFPHLFELCEHHVLHIGALLVLVAAETCQRVLPLIAARKGVVAAARRGALI